MCVHVRWVYKRESKRERKRESMPNNSLALVATEEHTSELLEALPDRVDVGKVLVHDLTVRIVVCNRDRDGSLQNEERRKKYV